MRSYFRAWDQREKIPTCKALPASRRKKIGRRKEKEIKWKTVLFMSCSYQFFLDSHQLNKWNILEQQLSFKLTIFKILPKEHWKWNWKTWSEMLWLTLSMLRGRPWLLGLSSVLSGTRVTLYIAFVVKCCFPWYRYFQYIAPKEDYSG